MALSIIASSENRLWARSPIYVVLATDAYQLTVARKPRFKYLLNTIQPRVAGDTLTFIFDSYSVTMTAIAANGTPDGNTFRIKAAGQSLSDWADVVVADLGLNLYLGSTFKVFKFVTGSGSAASVYLELLGDGIIRGYGSTGALGTPVITIENTTALATFQPNFSIRVELFVEENYRQGPFGAAKATFNLKPNHNSQVIVYAQKVVFDYLTVDLPQLPADNQLVKLCTEIQKRIWLRAVEQYGEPAVIKPYDTGLSIEAFVLKAGVSDAVYSDSYDPEQAPDVTKHKFLSLHPAIKVSDEQPEWLYFRRDIAEIDHVQIIVTFANGNTSQLQITLANLNAVSQAEDVVSIETGFDQLNLGAIATASPIIYWDIELQDNLNNQLYRSRRYYRNTNESRFTRYFVYQNSLGGMDTLRAEGTLSRKIDVKRAKAYRPKQYDFALPQRTVTNDKTSEETVHTVTSGHITKAHADYLEELERSDYVYEYRNGRFEPILIEAGSWQVEDDKGMYSVQFSYTAAYAEDIYMPYEDGQKMVY